MPNPQQVLTPAQLRRMLSGSDEIAVLDVRPEGLFSRSHLLQAVSAPHARLELVIDRLVPRRATPIVLVDEAEELCWKGLTRLNKLGYADVKVLQGGTKGWVAAGYVAFSGTNVPGKALGELVEHELGTPVIEPLELKRMLDDREDVVILDSRTFPEFKDFSMPGAMSCPTAELVYRFHEAVKSPDSLVVVNCAGRTRSIIGAQTLINAGVPNKVVSMKNSTMGWLFEGLKLERGKAAFAPAPSAAALAKAREHARMMGTNAGVKCISMTEYAQLDEQAASRTLYTFDVRTPDEYLAGHLPGARSAEGGQLVQAMDDYVGTKNARIALLDYDGVRAVVVATWLRQLCRNEVYVVDAAAATELEVGTEPRRVLREAAASVRWTDADALQRALNAGSVAVFDIESSLQYRDGHVPGAIFTTRDRLAESISGVDASLSIVVTSVDGVLAGIAAEELARKGREVRALLGGTRGWNTQGHKLEKAVDFAFRPDEDVWYGPYTYPPERLHEAFQTYIDWEIGLVQDAGRDGDTALRPRNLSLGPTDLAA